MKRWGRRPWARGEKPSNGRRPLRIRVPTTNLSNRPRSSRSNSASRPRDTRRCDLEPATRTDAEPDPPPTCRRGLLANQLLANQVQGSRQTPHAARRPSHASSRDRRTPRLFGGSLDEGRAFGGRTGSDRFVGQLAADNRHRRRGAEPKTNPIPFDFQHLHRNLQVRKKHLFLESARKNKHRRASYPQSRVRVSDILCRRHARPIDSFKREHPRASAAVTAIPIFCCWR